MKRTKQTAASKQPKRINKLSSRVQQLHKTVAQPLATRVNLNSQQAFQRLCWGVVWAGATLFMWSEVTPLGHFFDALLSAALFNRGSGQFILGSEGGGSWTEVWLHVRLKNALLLIPAFAAIQVLVGFWLNLRGDLNVTQNVTQREAWLRWCSVLACIVLSVIWVNLLKKWTNQACPWSLVDYGGPWAYVDFFAAKPWGAAAMQCWPAGHAFGGFSLLCLAFVGGWPANVWQTKVWQTATKPQPAWLSARAWVIYALILGTIMGLARVGQGAHFISHQFWSLWWVVALYTVFTYVGLIQRRWLA